MSLAQWSITVLWIGLTLYALLAGADFGAGFWDLVAGGSHRGRPQRELIAHSIGPVWEANHVWLIFVIVILFTAFPPAFAALSTGLFLVFHLVLVGITLRGAAFVFRAYGPRAGRTPARWGVIFGMASVITPVLLGMSLG
nr:cytochrome d ubiquinol oxidase subunit II [Actinomycetota bacterium]